MGLLRTNNIKIVGHLQDVQSKNGTAKNGNDYVSVTATIVSSINGSNKEYEVEFYSSSVTKDGKPNQLYASYCKMDELKGRKVEVTGSLSENRFWSEKMNQLSSSTRINGKFIKGVSEQTTDEGTFEIGGVLIALPSEKKNKDGVIYRYDVQLGQSNYAEDCLSMFTLHIEPNSRDILNGVNNYNVGDTIVLNGDLDFITTTVSKASESAFGKPVVKTYTSKQHNFFITGGSEPITSDEDGVYSGSITRQLIDAYKAKDVELMSSAKNKGGDKPVETKTPVTKRQTSLI